MNEFLFHSPDEHFELEARRDRVREGVALARRDGSAAPRPRRPHAGLAAVAALLGSRPRHRAA